MGRPLRSHYGWQGEFFHRLHTRGFLTSQIFRYHEKPFAQKLELLYSRDLYPYAINLAQRAGLDTAQKNIILRKYGDYLYRKQDYDTAMQMYLKAIDNTEPSQVIRKVSCLCYTII
jgi:tetratricopeptide (TPR) repeat protein